MGKRWSYLILLATVTILFFGSTETGLTASPKDTLKVVLWTRVSSLDPYNNAQMADYMVAEQIYDNLIVLDEKTRKPMPNLAASYKLINDTTWELVLRNDSCSVMANHSTQLRSNIH